MKKSPLTRIRWAVLAALALQASATGAASALDLVGAYEQALRHDPAKLAANEALAAGREKAVQGDALLRPRIGVQASVARIDDRGPSDSPLSSVLPANSSGTAYQATLQLTQPIYDAKASAEKKQLHQLSRLAELEFDHAQQMLALRVADAYFGVIAAQEALRVTLAEKAAIGMQRDRAQARYEVGRGKATELQETQARYDQILTKEINARSTLEVRRVQFAEITGASADALAELETSIAATPPEPDNLQRWQNKGDELSIAVRARRTQLEIARAEIAKHKLSGRPSLSLVASIGRRDQSGGLSPLVASKDHNSGSIGLQFSMPLYAGGALDSQARESQARLREAEQQLAAAARDMRVQVQDAFLAVRTGVSRITSAEQSLRSARTALEATTLGRDVGTRTEQDVLDAQQRAHAAELDAVMARIDYLMARIRLAAAAGDLGEQDLRHVNAWLRAQ